MINSFKIKSDFRQYCEVFLEENSKHNLISKNDEKVLFEKHIYDSLSLKIFLEKYNIQSCKILDIGCGGGFPCIPLAIELAEFDITGVDSIQKKINSVNTIIGKLGLCNIKTICIRAEKLNEQYDIVVSRAVASMEKICEYALPLLKKNGYFVAYKSKKAQTEIEEAKEVLNKYGAKIIDIIDYRLPLKELYERNLVVVKIC